MKLLTFEVSNKRPQGVGYSNIVNIRYEIGFFSPMVCSRRVVRFRGSWYFTENLDECPGDLSNALETRMQKYDDDQFKKYMTKAIQEAVTLG